MFNDFSAGNLSVIPLIKEENIMNNKNNRVCPVGRAGTLDNKLRRWIQNPQKILRPYITEGMTILDIGCGPGFFSIDMAKMAGESGKIIASDLQEGMLQKVRNKIKGTKFEKQITLHKCEQNKIGVSEHVDFVLLFYIVHEISNKENLFKEIETILKPNGQILIAEPPFHVSKAAFEEIIKKAEDAGFTNIKGPK